MDELVLSRLPLEVVTAARISPANRRTDADHDGCTDPSVAVFSEERAMQGMKFKVELQELLAAVAA